jgi:long-subunit acyl-CoA synthetase (AMP-forming)
MKVKAILISLRRSVNRSLPSSAAYGMTETSPTVSHVAKGSGKFESVGGPISNTEMKVVHPETRNILAARQTGEICMRGPQVSERDRMRVREREG